MSADSADTQSVTQRPEVPRSAPEAKRATLSMTTIPGTRLELVRPEGRGILSPLRLPIPPPGRDCYATP
jgi:hypothetical protein